VELEDDYRARAGDIKDCASGVVVLNDSHFFRSILHEVDLGESFSPSETDYRVSPCHGGTTVAYLGVVLLEAPDEETARKWVGRHLGWRRELDRSQPDQLRRDVLIAVSSMVKNIEEVLARSVNRP
jgi:hypothetical protein